MLRRGSIMVVCIGAALLASAFPPMGPAPQEPPVGLIADEVTYDRDAGVLTASGRSG